MPTAVILTLDNKWSAAVVLAEISETKVIAGANLASRINLARKLLLTSSIGQNRKLGLSQESSNWTACICASVASNVGGAAFVFLRTTCDTDWNRKEEGVVKISGILFLNIVFNNLKLSL